MPASPWTKMTPRVDRADLLSQLTFPVRGDLSAEDDQVDLFHIEPAADVGEVVGRLGLVTEVAEAGDRIVEDALALSNQKHAALGFVRCHVSSFVSLGGGRAGARSEGRCRRCPGTRPGR